MARCLATSDLFHSRWIIDKDFDDLTKSLPCWPENRGGRIQKRGFRSSSTSQLDVCYWLKDAIAKKTFIQVSLVGIAPAFPETVVIFVIG